MSAALLSVSGLTAGYRRDLPIIREVSAEVARGELVTIIGPNGAGKSTLIKAVAGFLPIVAGTVRFDGRDITGIAPHLLPAAGAAYVPQTGNIFSSLTIEENLKVGAITLPGTQAQARMDAALASFPDLVPYRRQKARVLSGGQRQMLAVARALQTQPRLVMLDEPSAGLAPKIVAEVFERLKALAASGVAVLMVEQNAKAAMAISDRTYVLAEGRNRIDGPSATLLEDPQVAEIYLGRAGRRH